MEASAGPVFSRRQFMVAAGALAAIGLTPGRALAGPLDLPGILAASKTSDLALSRFAPYVGSSFLLRTGTMRAERVTLAEATARTPRPADRAGLAGESFSLVFAGTGAKAFNHGTFTLVHPALGTFPLFLVAVDQGRQARHYQAVVDRRTPQA
jgi:hypothetical protein